MLTNPKLHSRFPALKTSGLLPSPKGVALAVLQLTQQENTTPAQLAHAVEADPALVAVLQRYPWPGNVREMRNVLKRIMILEEPADLRAEHFPCLLYTSPSPRD